MTEIKILAKCNSPYTQCYFWEKSGRSGEEIVCSHYISQEKVIEDGKEVPKWEIFISLGHPEVERIRKTRIDIEETFSNDEWKYHYEISFVDGEKGWIDREYPHHAKKNKRVRYFIEAGDNLTIKDNSYSTKLEELKSQDNLIPGEKNKWRGFIDDFKSSLEQLTNEEADKYQEGKKFIEELEAELNKKTGKDDNSRERERERESNSSDTSNKSKLLWIGLGTGGVVIIGVIIWLLTRKQR